MVSCTILFSVQFSSLAAFGLGHLEKEVEVHGIRTLLHEKNVNNDRVAGQH